MSVQQTPKVFLSHSHKDRPVARRLVRRLSAHGIKVWIDERELRLGSTLTSSIRDQIEASDAVLVVASKHSTVSKWVGMELEFARENSKDVIPFFIDPVAEHERFQDHLGVDATSPQEFADAVQNLMRDLFRSRDLELRLADSAMLTTELREIAREEPDLAPLILGCLDAEGLHQENMDTAFKAPFHPLDEALNALFDVKPTESTAYHVAYGFCLAGAGTRALSQWIAATGDGDAQLVGAVGTRLDPALIRTAIKLLGACDPPNNHALYNFIHHNADQFDEAQRRSVLRLVTWPVRTDTSRFADVLGWVASQHFPDAVEIPQMWSRWISSGVFDGKAPSGPNDLARYLADADKEQLRGWEHVNEALRSHVRKYLRSGDKQKVMTAVDHIRAASDKSAPILSTLLGEADGVAGTAEWEAWEKRDRDTAEWMQWYVFECAKEARGERNWSRAWKQAEQMAAHQQERRRSLAAPEQSSAG